MKVMEIDGVTWINDAYNANPDSVRAALERLAEIADPSDVLVVLGDMFELGAESARLRHSTQYSSVKAPSARLIIM
jgi:UDP-N-acetylmuramoyl-tripeptide--D-alanyl-D-alanine ligase